MLATACSTEKSSFVFHSLYSLPIFYDFTMYMKSLLRSLFGKSDHHSILLLPVYRQKLKQTTSTVHCWSEESDSTIQDCFDCVEWGVGGWGVGMILRALRPKLFSVRGPKICSSIPVLDLQSELQC